MRAAGANAAKTVESICTLKSHVVCERLHSLRRYLPFPPPRFQITIERQICIGFSRCISSQTFPNAMQPPVPPTWHVGGGRCGSILRFECISRLPQVLPTPFCSLAYGWPRDQKKYKTEKHNKIFRQQSERGGMTARQTRCLKLGFPNLRQTAAGCEFSPHKGNDLMGANAKPDCRNTLEKNGSSHGSGDARSVFIWQFHICSNKS